VNAPTPRIPFSIWALGGVSFLMKISSVIVFNLSPLFLKQTLGASLFSIAVLEAFIEAVTLFTRIFSGVISDYFHKRKFLISIGYCFALFSRPILGIANNIEVVFLGRAFDRIGNGLEGPPRDALVGDLAPPQIKGACYGLRESLSRAGSFVGALLAMGLLYITYNNYSLVFWIGSIPTALALVVLLSFVKDPVSEKFKNTKARKFISFNEIKALPPQFWLVLILSGIYMVSNFSGAFLILRAEETGIDVYLTPLVMVVQNIATAATSYPIGFLADRFDRRLLMGFGILLVILANFLLAADGSIYLVLAGVLLWGIEMGVAQCLLPVFLVETCPETIRGSGFGMFHLINGVCLMIANTLAGWVSTTIGSTAMFYTSASIAAFAITFLPFIKNRQS
jgi:MFS family permease